MSRLWFKAYEYFELNLLICKESAARSTFYIINSTILLLDIRSNELSDNIASVFMTLNNSYKSPPKWCWLFVWSFNKVVNIDILRNETYRNRNSLNASDWGYVRGVSSTFPKPKRSLVISALTQDSTYVSHAQRQLPCLEFIQMPYSDYGVPS